MAINYKKELEGASKTMILVHKPDVLIRMIVRMIVQKVKVSHSGILLHDSQRDTYILTVSGGQTGLKIPKGFARMDADNPLIKFFRNRLDKNIHSEGLIVYDYAKSLLKRKNLNQKTKQILKGVLYQMEIFGSTACIPSYFRDDLLGLLLLGEKINKKKFGKDELEFFVALAHDVAMAIK
ncbi:MAG: GAF domain-containing protein, partial [Candidatus Omnitrophota bacterium]